MIRGSIPITKQEASTVAKALPEKAIETHGATKTSLRSEMKLLNLLQKRQKKYLSIPYQMTWFKDTIDQQATI